ncbi:MAG: YihY/virulence factor BrkB family protein [Flavobacteriales bacterium]|nr:YihY/virulence factor BrkB family protein [Flavobacteriales bacterium]NQX97916.1 YihY/virulence factor BrkB family protein [Flavobacteriales bacterium]
MNSFIKKVITSKLVQLPLDLSKKLIIPGFDGLSIFEVLSFFIEGIQKNSLTTRASSLAFRFFLALFPSIIFLFSLIPYIPIDDFKIQLFELIRGMLPGEAYQMVSSTIEDLMTNRHEGLLSFGFLFAFYLASNGVNSMVIAFNETSHSTKKSSFIQTRLRSLLILFIIIFLMVIAIGLIVFSAKITSYLITNNYITHDFIIYLIKAAKAIILLAVFFFGISSIYYFGNTRSEKFRFMSAGSTLATLLSILLSSGFAYYINNFGTYNKVYGSIGTLMVIMLWLYFNSLVLLMGFELNASISHAKKNKLNSQK